MVRFIMIIQSEYCGKCGKEYNDKRNEWCKPCQINYFKNKFVNWTSGNEKIDNFIQEKQLSIDNYYDRVLEWIPYNQFNDIKEVGKNVTTTVYLAIWKDGPLYYDDGKKELIRKSNEKVALKCLENSQNIIDEFLNEV